MSRDRGGQMGKAADAAKAASEAGRVLQQRGQETVVKGGNEFGEAPKPQTDARPLEKRNPDREQAMNEIRKKHAERNGEVLEEEPKKAPKAEEPKAKAEPKAEEKKEVSPTGKPPVETTPVVEAAPEAPKTVKVKVDGEEFDAPEADVEAAGGLHAYQRDRASENRLKKANDTLAEARKAQSQIIELATALQRPAAPQKTQESDQQFIATKMDVVRFGSQEDAAAAMLEIQQRLNKAPDTNAIVEQATNRFRHDQAVASFDKEFQDLVTNPIRLKTIVALREERLQRHKIEKPNDPIDWNSFYRTIGTEVRSAFGGQSQPPSAPQAVTGGTPSPASDKEARKASIVNLPTAAARATAPTEEKELSPEEQRQAALRQMREKRGQLAG